MGSLSLLQGIFNTSWLLKAFRFLTTLLIDSLCPGVFLKTFRDCNPYTANIDNPSSQTCSGLEQALEWFPFISKELMSVI